jgi:hypothetical protein
MTQIGGDHVREPVEINIVTGILISAADPDAKREPDPIQES